MYILLHFQIRLWKKDLFVKIFCWPIKWLVNKRYAIYLCKLILYGMFENMEKIMRYNIAISEKIFGLLL